MTDRKPMLLGNKVKSDVYNIEGIAVMFYHHSPDRVPQICVQPVSTDMTKVADAQFMDTNLVDYVDDGCVDRLIPLVHNPFTYGDKVREKVSGLTGIVTGWIEMMNGCIDIQISPDCLDKEGKPYKASVYEIGRVEKVATKEEKIVQSSQTISDKQIAGLSEPVTNGTHSNDPVNKPNKSLVDKVKDVLSPSKQLEHQEIHTTEPAKRPAPKTGSAMHRGIHLNRNN